MVKKHFFCVPFNLEMKDFFSIQAPFTISKIYQNCKEPYQSMFSLPEFLKKKFLKYRIPNTKIPDF